MLYFGFLSLRSIWKLFFFQFVTSVFSSIPTITQFFVLFDRFRHNFYSSIEKTVCYFNLNFWRVRKYFANKKIIGWNILSIWPRVYFIFCMHIHTFAPHYYYSFFMFKILCSISGSRNVSTQFSISSWFIFYAISFVLVANRALEIYNAIRLIKTRKKIILSSDYGRI